MAEHFFDEQAEQSKVKTAIVASYFVAWARVISGFLSKKPDKRIAYVDLFAGPGRYKDGTKSTPLFILEQAATIPALRDNLISVFNDKDPQNAESLVNAIAGSAEAQALKHPPQVHTEEVGERMVDRLENIATVPTLIFVDPWGYKGLSLRLINSVLKNFGCECIFFFNYNRINMGLSNPVVREHMEALFGAERAGRLMVQLKGMDPADRELAVVEQICEALKELGGKYVLPFAFKDEKGVRTRHHLVFVSKHPLGYEIMKDVMAKQSSSAAQGVPSFEYSPASRNQPILFELSRPLDDLNDLLLEAYAGQTRTMAQIFEEHNVGRPYVKRNYKEVLTAMEKAGRIVGAPPHPKRRVVKGQTTCADAVQFTFPARDQPS